LFAGLETKIYLNNGKYAFKTSKLERYLNIMVMCNIIILFVVDGIMAGRALRFLKEHGA
jgi:hypothetical protein